MAGRFIRTTHVGSLVRPPELVGFLHQPDQGQPIDQRAFEVCLRNAVADVVAQQCESASTS